MGERPPAHTHTHTNPPIQTQTHAPHASTSTDRNTANHTDPLSDVVACGGAVHDGVVPNELHVLLELLQPRVLSIVHLVCQERESVGECVIVRVCMRGERERERGGGGGGSLIDNLCYVVC